MLYVHGWSDYFFNPELARFWTDAGARFFALDLRKYGRSLRPGQTPGYITNLADYDADIEAALAAMGHGATDPVGASARPLILLGHSTGGLTLSLWSARNPGRAAGARPQQSVAGVPAEPHRARGAAAGHRVRRAGEPDGSAAERRPRLLRAIDREGAGRRVGVLARVASRSGLHDASGLAHGRPRRAHARSRSASTSARPCSRSCRRDPRCMPRWDPAMLTTDIVLVVDDIAQRSLQARPRGGGRAHRRGAARRVPVARAGARRGLRVGHALAARVRPSRLTQPSGCRAADPAPRERRAGARQPRGCRAATPAAPRTDRAAPPTAAA